MTTYFTWRGGKFWAFCVLLLGIAVAAPGCLDSVNIDVKKNGSTYCYDRDGKKLKVCVDDGKVVK